MKSWLDYNAMHGYTRASVTTLNVGHTYTHTLFCCTQHGLLCWPLWASQIDCCESGHLLALQYMLYTQELQRIRTLCLHMHTDANKATVLL
jgi:hypothetical protein